MRGKFIVVEGLEGAGKSTAIAVIKAYLTKHGVDRVLNTREPGGTIIAEEIRAWIKGQLGQEILSMPAEVLLMFVARVQLLDTVIKPALQRGEWVIGDRHNLSTLAYQGGGRGVDEQVLRTLQDFCLQGFKPDLTLYLDICPEQGLKRVMQRGEKDRIEQESLAFFQRIQASYRHWVDEDPSCRIIDASQSMDNVHTDIERELEKFLAGGDDA